jgi:tetratricopeptide (TPR) repeat protein
MLTPKEQRVLSKLSVFRGFGRDAAEQVGGASVSILASLVSKSLVRRANSDRYDLHELIRQYARERLIESGEWEAVLREHLHFFLEVVEAAEPQLQTAEQPVWLNRLDVESDNLRLALEWSLSYGNGDAEHILEEGLRLAGGLWQYWLVRGHMKEGRQWLAVALEKSSGNGLASTPARAKALVMAVGLADFHGDLSSSIPLCEEALAVARDLADQRVTATALIFLGDYQARYAHNWPRNLARLNEALNLARQLGDKWLTALTLQLLGIGARAQGDQDRAKVHLEESLALSRELGDPWLISGILDNLGSQEVLKGNYERATLLYDEALRLRRELKDSGGVAGILNDMGQLARYQLDYVRAAQCFEESLALFKEYGQKESSAIVLHNLGYVTLQRGELVRAAALFGESLAIFRELENMEGIICSLAGVAGVTSAGGQVEEAVRLFGAVDAMLQSTGAVMPPVNRAEYERMLAAAQAALPEPTFAAAWAEGHGTKMKQAIAEWTDATFQRGEKRLEWRA